MSGGTQNRVHSMSKCWVSLAAKTLGESKDSNFLAPPWQLLPRETGGTMFSVARMIRH